MAPAGPVGIDRCAMKLQTAALWDNGRMHAELDAKPTDLITINPGTLDDATQWSLRDLQRLCVRLGIPAKGRREQLVARHERVAHDGDGRPAREAEHRGSQSGLAQRGLALSNSTTSERSERALFLREEKEEQAPTGLHSTASFSLFS